MSEEGKVRCPVCGALAALDADWCGQCYASLGPAGEPASPHTLQDERRAPGPEDEPALPAYAGAPHPPVRSNGNGKGSEAHTIPEAPPYPFARGPAATKPAEPAQPAEADARPRPTWPCAVCGHENELELDACEACLAPFGKLFEGPQKARPKVDPSTATKWSLLFPGLGHIRAGRTADGVARAILFAWCLGTVALVLTSHPAGGLGFLAPMVFMFVVGAVAIYGLSAVDANRAAQGVAPVLTARFLLYGTAAAVVLSVGSLFILVTKAIHVH